MGQNSRVIPANASGDIARIQADLDLLKHSLLGAALTADDGHASRASQVRAMLTARRKRETVFGKDLFADPAWDMLLELYWAELKSRQVSTTELCLGSAVPQTTALRWIEKLERDAWILRTHDHLDGRRLWVALTPRGTETMHRYFDELESQIALR